MICPPSHVYIFFIPILCVLCVLCVLFECVLSCSDVPCHVFRLVLRHVLYTTLQDSAVYEDHETSVSVKCWMLVSVDIKAIVIVARFLLRCTNVVPPDRCSPCAHGSCGIGLVLDTLYVFGSVLCHLLLTSQRKNMLFRCLDVWILHKYLALHVFACLLQSCSACDRGVPCFLGGGV